MKMRIIHWNISWKGDIQKKILFLKKHITYDSIICLQEVQSSDYQNIIDELNPEIKNFSLELRAPGNNEMKNRKLGVCILGYSCELSGYGLVNRSVFPERTNIISIIKNGKKVSILSFHSITGCDYKKAKASNFAVIADFLEDNNIDFFTCDANESMYNYFDESKLEFYDNGDKGKYASLLLGRNRVHNLNDTLRDWYNKKNIINTDFFKEYSYKIGNTEKRYDYIYYNPNRWEIKNIIYEYNKAIKVGSDHALIIGDYEYK